MYKAILLKFEKAIILTFVNPSLVSIPGWIEQKKLLVLGFGIFGSDRSPRRGNVGSPSVRLSVRALYAFRLPKSVPGRVP